MLEQHLVRGAQKSNNVVNSYGLGWARTSTGLASLFPRNGWDSALPRAWRPPWIGRLIIPGRVLCLLFNTLTLQEHGGYGYGTTEPKRRQRPRRFVSAVV